MAEIPVNNNLILELHVPDFDTARDFYGALDFEDLEYDEPSVPGGLGYLVMYRTDSIGVSYLNFYGDNQKVHNHRHFSQFPNETPRGYGVEITLPVSDLEKTYEKFVNSLGSSAVAQEITERPWGKKDFRFIDPFGFYGRVSELVDWGQIDNPRGNTA